jgi:hypothetical protein
MDLVRMHLPCNMIVARRNKVDLFTFQESGKLARRVRASLAKGQPTFDLVNEFHSLSFGS